MKSRPAPGPRLAGRCACLSLAHEKRPGGAGPSCTRPSPRQRLAAGAAGVAAGALQPTEPAPPGVEAAEGTEDAVAGACDAVLAAVSGSSGTMSRATMLMILMSGFTAGPAVSL